MSCYYPVPSITATMEEMPERYTLSIQFHPLPPQWRRCQKGTREASSSIHYRHNGGDARKAHVKHPLPPQWRRCQKGTREASSTIHYRHNGGKADVKHPVPSITATMEEMPERHTLAGQIMVSLDILCDRPYVLLLSSSIHYRHNGGDARKEHVKHPVPSITATMEEMPERHT